MGAVRFTAALVSLAAAACGGMKQPGGPPACTHGPTLVRTSSSVITSVPIFPPAQTEPLMGQYFMNLTSMAATPGGDRFLVTWTTVDAQSLVPEGHVAIAQIGRSGVIATSFAAAPPEGQATFDGTDFVVTGTLPLQEPPRPGPGGSDLLQMQRFDPRGQSQTLPLVTIETVPVQTYVTSIVSTPRGLAVALNAIGASAAGPVAHALLVGPDGKVEDDIAMGAVVDPATGLIAAPTPGLTVFDGQLIVAYGNVISATDWLGGTAQRTQTSFHVRSGVVGIKGLFDIPLFESGGQLMVWGEDGELQVPDAGVATAPYAGMPGGSFTRVATVDPSALTQQSEGCGGVVTLLWSGLPDGDPRDELSIQWGSPGVTTPVGTASLGPSGPYGPNAAMTPTSTGAAVTWVDPAGVHLGDVRLGVTGNAAAHRELLELPRGALTGGEGREYA